MDGAQGGPSNPGSTGNSSDFVRKLYKMLEDPSYSQIVRWGDERDSFVVLECEKFTKSILPKHFKHSNFASFVRQLNKYDFHKVRQNNEETGQSPYGPNAWEFKHPEFKANNKDSLDNIRRKAPAPRKSAQSNEDSIPIQQIDLLNQQLLAQQQQIQQLSDRFAQLGVDQQLMLQEMRRVQKTVTSHEQVVQYLMNYLHSVDARLKRDNNNRSAAFQTQGGVAGNSDLSPSQVGAVDDDVPSTPLQQATKLLSEMNSEIQFNLSSLEGMSDMQNRMPGAVPTPPLDQSQPRNGVVRPQTSGNSSSSLAYAKLNGNELESVVYPVGATNGIDPMYSEHVNNIPYSIPPKELEQPDSRRQYNEGQVRKKSTYTDPGWIRNPRVLLVEDDLTCRQIGGKFIQSFACVVDSACDGLEAVNKIQEGAKYDLILMDIIMPHLDGVSASSLIRRTESTPIIAMTSNIRTSDIELYFHNGMNDVLPKPFTRQSLQDMLDKQLVHLRRMQAPPPPMDGPQPGTVGAMAQNSGAASVKTENSPGQSPGTAVSMGNWQAAGGQFQGLSPINPSMANQFMQQPQPATPNNTTTPSFVLDQNSGMQFANPAATQMGVMSAPNSATTPTVPTSTGPGTTAGSTSTGPGRTQQQQQHRRQVSEMSSPADANGNQFSKRQRVFASTNNNPPVVNPMQTNRIP